VIGGGKLVRVDRNADRTPRCPGRLRQFIGQSSIAILHREPLYHPARLEFDRKPLAHHDLLAGPWVACLPGLPLLHLKDTEVAEFDAACRGMTAAREPATALKTPLWPMKPGPSRKIGAAAPATGSWVPRGWAARRRSCRRQRCSQSRTCSRATVAGASRGHLAS